MNKMENVLQNKKVSGLQEVCLAGKTADRKRRREYGNCGCVAFWGADEHSGSDEYGGDEAEQHLDGGGVCAAYRFFLVRGDVVF